MGERVLETTTSSSRSRSVTASVQAVHSFEVTSFSLLEGMGTDAFVSSRTFCAGGRSWNIRVYPDGWKKEDKAEYVSAFLCMIDEPKDATKTRTKYNLELLLPKDGNNVSELTMYSTVMFSHTFETTSFWGKGKFVEKSKLKPLLRPNVDCFTVRCTLTIIGESQSEDVLAAPAIMVEEFPEPNIHQHFEHMLKTGKGADMTFDVDGHIFRAHRCVLAARSAVFEAELLGPMKDKAIEEPISVADMEPSIFEQLLHFIYTDSVSECKNNDDDDDCKSMSMQHLQVAADRYGLDRLRLMCEVSLCRRIDVQTVATMLALAEQHHCARLKGACLKFLATRRDILGVVMKTDGFKHLVTSFPLIMVEILDKIAEA